MAANVAIDARYVQEPLSGIGRYTLNLLCGIAEASPDRRILVLTSGVSSLPEAVRRCPSFEFVGRRTSNPRGLAEQFTAPRAIRRHGIRLLHSPDAFAPLCGSCLKVITIHDLIPIACRDALYASSKARWWRLWLAWLKLQCRAASRVITVSQHSAMDIERFLNVSPERIRIIPNGVQLPAQADPPAEVRRITQGGPFILYVGRRDPYKNLAGLVRAFALVRIQKGDARLVLAGAPDPRYREVEIESQRLGLGNSVVLAGHVGDAGLAELYRNAAVFAFPSLYEGFGLPPLEAMACGAPVVASNRTSVPETVGDAAILVDPADPSDMAQGILRVLSDRPLALKLREKGFQRAASFTVKKQAEQTLRLYEELAGRF
jgi:glycosyltransferase involved in cell wall biosynthesis